MSESFADLFESSIQEQNVKVGNLIMGTVVAIDREKVIINAGLKSEAFVPLVQFKNSEGELEVKEGDVVEVALDSIDDGLGHTLLSRTKAKNIKAWQKLENAMENKEIIKCRITNSIKGGLTVDIDSVKAFLPGSLVDIRSFKDFGYLEGKEIEVIVVKMDKVRNNIVVSRRAVLEMTYPQERENLLNSLEVGKEVEGTVKNLADYGAFIDLGGIDGLLHITDISWDRVNHPSEKINIGDRVTTKVLALDKEKRRVSLGLKQLQSSPWEGIKTRLKIGDKVSGKVSNIVDYGAFVKIEEGIEGLVHTSELDWTNQNAIAAKIVKLGQEVNIVVLDLDVDKHRISLSIKQAQENPWQAFANNYSKGDKLTGLIKSITDFGIFVGLPGNIDGLVHLADISWEKQNEQTVLDYKNMKNQKIDVMVLNIDPDKERISLGIKQLTEDSFHNYVSKHSKSKIVKGIVTEVDSRGAKVKLTEDIEGYIKANEISQDKTLNATAALTEGQEIEAIIIKVDRKSRNIQLSIKQKKYAEEKAAIADYSMKIEKKSSSPTLGDLLKKAGK